MAKAHSLHFKFESCAIEIEGDATPFGPRLSTFGSLLTSAPGGVGGTGSKTIMESEMKGQLGRRLGKWRSCVGRGDSSGTQCPQSMR